MKRICLLTLYIVFGTTATAQTLKVKLDAAVKQLEKDAQLKHGLIGLSVIDAATGKSVYERNAEIGLAPASTQKIFTSIAAFELLGKDYRYKTAIGFEGEIDRDSLLHGGLRITPSGDPTFGSWRFNSTKSATIIESIVNVLRSKGIKSCLGDPYFTVHKFEPQYIPDGWIWEDIGNYYGAGAYPLNWNENQFDLILKPGKKEGDSVIILGTRPPNIAYVINELKTGAKGSGDNAYIYFHAFFWNYYAKGTVPCCVDSFTISGAADGVNMFFDTLAKYVGPNREYRDPDPIPKPGFKLLFDHYSPTFDSINYHFLKRSINLYGEALIKTISLEKVGIGSTIKGIEVIKDFFGKIGIDNSSIKITDGSGLSPQNRVTTNALTKALRYAKSRPWFSSFYYALPEINGMKMKSGLIGGVRSYAGYQKAANGKEYIFAIIVNNYDGSSSEINKKLFKILDYLK